MLAKLHTKHAYLHYIILIVLATGLWIRPLINGCWMVEAGDEIPFYQWLYTIIPTESIAVVFTGFTLVIIEAILLNYILIKHRLLPPNTYFTFYIYVLIMSQSPIVLTLNPVICGALFAIPSIGLILYINSHPKPATITFFSTVLMAIASMFCFEMIFFFLLLFISFGVYKKHSARLILSALTGFILIYFFLLLYYLLTDSMAEKISHYINWIIHPPLLWSKIEIYQYILLGWQAYLMYMAIKYIIIKMNTLNKEMRETLLICIYFIPISLFSMLYMTGNMGMAVLLSSIPFSIFLGIYISLTTKKSMIWLQLLFLLSWYLGIFLQNMYFAKC